MTLMASKKNDKLPMYDPGALRKWLMQASRRGTTVGDTRMGCWTRIGGQAICSVCRLIVPIFQVVWSDDETDSIICRGCAEALNTPKCPESLTKKISKKDLR